MSDDEPIRRKHPFTARCMSCGAEIVWFKTKKGNNMPVDESSTKPTDATLDLPRHVSHFSTCPDHDKWRKPR